MLTKKRFGFLENPMKDIKNGQKKNRLVKTWERTRRAFSLRSGLLSSITRRSMDAMLCAVVLDWVKAPVGLTNNATFFIEIN